MVVLKAGEVERYLSRPDPALRTILLFGQDSGLVSERAERIAASVAKGDALAVQRFESDELAATPGRLADEAYGGSLFAGSRAIRVRVGGNRPFLPSLEPLLDAPPRDAWIILEAGELRKTAPLRRACEQAKTAAAIACYPDNEGALHRLIDEEMSAAGLVIAQEARERLIGLLGADRIASRGEVRKLALYAAGEGTVTPAHVTELIGDGAAFALDEIADAAGLGRPADVDRGLRRLAAAGTAAFSAASAAERHFQMLHRHRAAVEAGSPVGAVLDAIRPPLFYSRRADLDAQLRLWPLAALEWALDRLHQAILDTRLRPGVEASAVGEALATIALRGSRLRAGAAKPGG